MNTSVQINAHLAEVTGLLNGGAQVFLEQGAATNFESLPIEYRGLAQQTARLLGITQRSSPAGQPPSFAQLQPRLEVITSASIELADASKLDFTTAFTHDLQQRAGMLQPHVQQLRDAGRLTADALREMPLAQLHVNKKVVLAQVPEWSAATEKIHEQLKAQLGETHPLTASALEARTEAAAVYASTMSRLLLAKVGNAAYGVTVGPVISGLSRLFGIGG